MDRSSLIHMKRQLNVTDLSGEKVMIDFETGKYFLIKGVGNDIWDMIQSDITVGDIISKLMEEYDGWDGFFGTDLLAMYCVKYAQERGLRIPEDIQIVSVDGTNTTTVCYPEITSIVQPIGELAKECVRQMMLLIQGKREEASDVVLDIEVKIGSTTKQPVGNPF